MRVISTGQQRLKMRIIRTGKADKQPESRNLIVSMGTPFQDIITLDDIRARGLRSRPSVPTIRLYAGVRCNDPRFTDHRSLLFVFNPAALEPTLGRHKMLKLVLCILSLSTV